MQFETPNGNLSPAGCAHEGFKSCKIKFKRKTKEMGKQLIFDYSDDCNQEEDRYKVDSADVLT